MHGLVKGNNVVWQKDGKFISELLSQHEVEYFVGLPEIGKNYVWKDLDSDPTLFLNYFQKAKSSMQPISILAR